MTDDIVAQLRADVEQRVREQLARHQRIEPTIDLSQVVDIQIGQERERMERVAEKFYDEGKDNIAEFVDAVIDWLPELAQDLKRR